jgi:hypothetical protein
MAVLLKPPVRARRIRALRTRSPRTVLTAHAIDALFRTAKVMTEGDLSGAPPTWYGTVLVTFDLADLVEGAHDPEGELGRLVEAIAGSVRVRILAHRLARAQVQERFPDRSLGTVRIESVFRRSGQHLLLDVDLEAPVEVASARRRAR